MPKADIIKGLNSSNESCQQEAILKADRRLALLKKTPDNEDKIVTKTNRTVINTSSEGNMIDDVLPFLLYVSGNFLVHLEKDAKEREERRKENKALATALKDLGNKAFSRGDYDTAVKHYSEGLEKLRDMQVLYTNRAQAYIKLSKFQDAIVDCEWALKCDEKCAKAHVHMGKAYLGLKNYSEARKCYLKVLENNPNLNKLAKDYLNEVDLQEIKYKQEQSALEEYKAGKEEAVSVIQLLNTLSKANQVPLYYSGGIRILTEVVKDCTGQTLFRMNNGFTIIGENIIISRTLESTAQPDPVQTDLCVSVLDLWKTVCYKNEENMGLFISNPNMRERILSLLSSPVPDIQSKTLALVGLYSSTEKGRLLLLQSLNPHRLLQILLEFVNIKYGTESATIEILQNITQDERLKILLRPNFASTSLPSFTDLLKSLHPGHRDLLPECISLLDHLIEDGDIRAQVSDSLECWDYCLNVLDECILNEEGERDILFAVLGLMLNLSSEVNPAIQERWINISERCMKLLHSKDGAILTRCVGILSRVLPQCVTAVEQAVQSGIVKKAVKLLKAGGQKTSLYAVKVLAVCTKVSTEAQKDVIKYDKNLRILLNLLHSENEIIIGNIALCLGNCFCIPGAASSLLKTDILKLLLTHAGGNAKRTTVQQNTAIALGKLCTAEPRYMSQLRELHGIEILNSCMKYV
ncbi:hypothetical protein GDO86_012716 [Hymenochirus boettgeri]|uniref:Tetratricopeptide repeat protein 12 n=1 Tax=Hymenochirus boettgeri TaxID=247094 RepID=A0A8T2ITV4_9PIPI|nr:hypothetical protein GDO86_012716 [Hymenochirus boettgeri]